MIRVSTLTVVRSHDCVVPNLSSYRHPPQDYTRKHPATKQIELPPLPQIGGALVGARATMIYVLHEACAIEEACVMVDEEVCYRRGVCHGGRGGVVTRALPCLRPPAPRPR